MKNFKKICWLISILITHAYGAENINELNIRKPGDQSTQKLSRKLLETNNKFFNVYKTAASSSLDRFTSLFGTSGFGFINTFNLTTRANIYQTKGFSVLPNYNNPKPFGFLYSRYETANELTFINYWNKANWMKNIKDDIYISTLAIPGTHDTATWNTGTVLESITRTQRKEDNFTKQLNDGIRFFDIRVRYDSSGVGWNLFHRDVGLGLSFDNLQTKLKSWLNSHPTETIVMSIKYEGLDSTNKMPAVFDSYYKKDSSLWYIANDIPQLKDVRGKIILAARYKNSSKGWDLGSWPDDTTFTSKNKNFSFNVQDQYTASGIDKSVAFLDFMDKNKNYYGKSQININFQSTTNFYCAYTPKDCSEINNSFIYSKYNSDQRKYRPRGIIPLDFYDEAMVSSILLRNSEYLKP